MSSCDKTAADCADDRCPEHGRAATPDVDRAKRRPGRDRQIKGPRRDR